MVALKSKLSTVSLVFFFNIYPVGNLFIGQRSKYCSPSENFREHLLAKSNAEAKKNLNSLTTFQNTKLLKTEISHVVFKFRIPGIHLKSLIFSNP